MIPKCVTLHFFLWLFSLFRVLKAIFFWCIEFPHFPYWFLDSTLKLLLSAEFLVVRSRRLLFFVIIIISFVLCSVCLSDHKCILKRKKDVMSLLWWKMGTKKRRQHILLSSVSYLISIILHNILEEENVHFMPMQLTEKKKKSKKSFYSFYSFSAYWSMFFPQIYKDFFL